eukprot:m.223140 g.223140  ORF g.223140 m.223140 type:complete len:357 (+) comp10878_c0_seq1:101-1171(+)
MGRKKISIQPIADDRNRQVTLNKRKAGLMKKAYELSVLCNCDIALMIFDSQGRHYQYSNKPIGEVLEKVLDADPTECQNNESLERLIKNKRAQEIAQQAQGPVVGPQLEPAVPVGTAEMPSYARASAKPAAVPNLKVKIPGEAGKDFPPGTRPRLPSFNAAGPMMFANTPMYDGQMLPALPSLGFGSMGSPAMPDFPFPNSPSVLHTNNAGALFVSNSVQQQTQKIAQLQRQNSAGLPPQTGLQRQNSGPYPPMTFTYGRQPSVSDLFAPPMRSNSIPYTQMMMAPASQDGLATMAQAAEMAGNPPAAAQAAAADQRAAKRNVEESLETESDEEEEDDDDDDDDESSHRGKRGRKH